MEFLQLRHMIHIRERSALSLLTVCAAAVLFFVPLILGAQSDSHTVAQTISVADEEVAYGDIILYDDETDLYRRSQVPDDPRVFGVVVESPSLLIETDPDLVPVIRAGRVPVNVTLENGAIETGDPLVTSSTPGMAMSAKEEEENVFGFATAPFDGEGGEEGVNEDGETVVTGTIVAEVGGDRLQEYLEEHGLAQSGTSQGGTEGSPLGAGTVMRFGIASLVALASIFVTFYTFLASIRSGVASMGRNPRAKAAIRSMVILNIVLALIVTVAGLFFAISLLVIET